MQVITVPPKIWRPKAKNNYKPTVCTDVNDELYVLRSYGKSIIRSPKWKSHLRTDLILWDESSFTCELVKDLRIDNGIDPTIRQSVINIIHDNWDSFCEQEAARHIFDFDFCLDTGNSKPDYYRQPSYGIHERKIMNAHIQIIEDNDWICDYESAWGSLLLLSPKPHQEGCNDINDFVWRLYVSYRPLNGITKNFENPIPRCSDSI